VLHSEAQIFIDTEIPVFGQVREPSFQSTHEGIVVLINMKQGVWQFRIDMLQPTPERRAMVVHHVDILLSP
jgi:hypothetical protein